MNLEKQNNKIFLDLVTYAKNQGGSVEEFVLRHIQNIEKNPALKALLTKDKSTLDIANNILQNNEFLSKNILGSRDDESSKQLKSQEIKINDIQNSRYFSQYREQKNKKAVAFIGGPAAEDGAVMAALIPDFKNKTDEIFYIIDDYRKSNVSSSAKQLHARHAVPLNAEDCLTGHALVSTLLRRALTGVSLEKAVDAHYIKVDINYKTIFKNLGIYLGNELDWFKKTLENARGKLTDNDWGRIESFLTISLLQITEQLSGCKITEYKGPDNKSYSIHLTFSKHEDEGLRVENKNFEQAGIFARQLSNAEIVQIFGDNSMIFSAYHYPSDSNILFDAHETNRQIAENKGVNWIEGATLKQVFLESVDSEAHLAGIEIEKEGELKFIRLSQMHTTLGYRAEYVFAKNRFGSKKFNHEIEAEKYLITAVKNFRAKINQLKDFLQIEGVNTRITTAAGMSMNLILKKTAKVQHLMDQFDNSTGQLAVTNSHWTMVAQDNDHVIIRVTGGGNTGSEEYKSTYFLNTFANTIRIFGEDSIAGIISTYACSRAINSNNATSWLQPANGWIVSYGKGGTGNSERTAEAAFAAMFLGFNKEVTEFYDKFQNKDGRSIGEAIQTVFKRVSLGGKNHFEDLRQRVACRMGYKSSGIVNIVETGLMVAIVLTPIKLLMRLFIAPKSWSYHLISMVKLKGKMPAIIVDSEIAQSQTISNDNSEQNSQSQESEPKAASSTSS
ncbi:MAG: hypothetical protein EXR06_04230 [Rickettsiales bacterium]|nr:hypothetical protein [Rickettsiales bacterium]